MSVNSNLHAKSRRVYLDKFVTLPHLPSSPGTGPGFNKKIDYMSPNLDHTGIRTAFQERVKRPVKPNGRLTYDYRLNANSQVAVPSRTLAKLEKKKVRSHFEKNSTYEERLLAFERKRQALGSTCERQLEAEKDFLLSTEELEEGGSTVRRRHSKKSRGGKNVQAGEPRPKKIFNQQGIVDCLIETTDMSICSSSLAPAEEDVLDDGTSHSTLRSGSTWRSGSTRGTASRWHPGALEKVYGTQEHEAEHDSGLEREQENEPEQGQENTGQQGF